MRMDTSCGETAAEWLARASVEEIAEVLADFGEERFAHRIARAIVEARSRAPITTTGALAKLVEAAVPKNRRDAAQHPATRTFQAVRIQVNHELDELKTTLESAGALLARPVDWPSSASIRLKTALSSAFSKSAFILTEISIRGSRCRRVSMRSRGSAM